jgi:hypothetical protein
LRQRVWLRRRRMDRRLLRLRRRVRKLLAVVAVLRPVDLALLLAGQMTSTTLTLSRVGRWPVCTENLIRVDEVVESPKLVQ